MSDDSHVTSHRQTTTRRAAQSGVLKPLDKYFSPLSNFRDGPSIQKTTLSIRKSRTWTGAGECRNGSPAPLSAATSITVRPVYLSELSRQQSQISLPWSGLSCPFKYAIRQCISIYMCSSYLIYSRHRHRLHATGWSQLRSPFISTAAYIVFCDLTQPHITPK